MSGVTASPSTSAIADIRLSWTIWYCSGWMPSDVLLRDAGQKILGQAIGRVHQSGGECGHRSGQCLLLVAVCLVAAVEGSIQQLRVGGKQVPIKALGDFLDVRADDWQCRLNDGSRLVRQHCVPPLGPD